MRPSTTLGPCGDSQCPYCRNSSQNVSPADRPDLMRCASCKNLFLPILKIYAKDLIDKEKSITKCARDIAITLSQHMRDGAHIILSVVGVRGVCTTFFNVLFKTIDIELAGVVNWINQFNVETENDTQQMIYEQSRKAITNDLIALWKKEVYENPEIIDSGDAFHFESLAVGFFMAKGKTVDEACELYKQCIKLDCF